MNDRAKGARVVLTVLLTSCLLATSRGEARKDVTCSDTELLGGWVIEFAVVNGPGLSGQNYDCGRGERVGSRPQPASWSGALTQRHNSHIKQ